MSYGFSSRHDCASALLVVLRRISILLCCAGAFVAEAAHAQGEACLSAYDESQRSRRGGELLKTREQLLVCAQESCPQPIAKECTRWLAEVTASVPTVVLGAKDAAGRDVFDVRVYDGANIVSETLDGRAVMLDPGAHVLRFVFSDGAEVTEKVLVRESEKNRVVTARLPETKQAQESSAVSPKVHSEPAAVAAPSSSGPPVLSIVLGSVGVAALASFAYFGLSAKGDSDELDRRCSPRCPTSETDAVKRKALIADISLGVGLASFAGATYFWLTAAPSSDSSGTRVTAAGIAGRF